MDLKDYDGVTTLNITLGEHFAFGFSSREWLGSCLFIRAVKIGGFLRRRNLGGHRRRHRSYGWMTLGRILNLKGIRGGLELKKE
jgi:hypothetical protein